MEVAGVSAYLDWSRDVLMAPSVIGAPPLGAGHEAARQRANSAGLGDQMVTALKSDSTTPSGDQMPDSLILDHIRSRVTRITPERAAVMLGTLAYERQRNISSKHVDYLLAMMQKGELTDLLIQEAEFPNGRKVLVDGYHRLSSLVQYGQPLLAVVVTYRVNSEQELNERYAKIDRPATRRPSDMLRAFGIDQQTELSAKMLKVVSAGAVIVANDFPRTSGGNNQKSVITRTHDVQKWIAEGEAYAACLAGSTSEIQVLLTRAPVVAVALATLRYQRGLAESFWSRIAAEDALPKDSPEARLLAWLRANRVNQVGQQVIYSRYVAGAWNAYYESRPLKLLKIADPSAPVVIAGTPYGKA
jgi:hypothetical protein